jgi:hypothetical protein
MRNFLIAVVVIFCVTLAVVIGNRMSTEAMAVVIGVVCGVAASIPVSILILLATRVGRGSDQAMPQGHGAAPPVVVIQGGQPLQAGQGYAPYYLPAVMNSLGGGQQREFTVVGDESQ